MTNFILTEDGPITICDSNPPVITNSGTININPGVDLSSGTPILSAFNSYNPANHEQTSTAPLDITVSALLKK